MSDAHPHLGRPRRAKVYNGDNRAHGGDIARIITERAGAAAGRQGCPHKSSVCGPRQFRLTVRDRKLVMEAIACIDSAIWDLLGKVARRQCVHAAWRLTDQAADHCIGGYYEEGKTLSDLAARWAGCSDAGMAGCKVKVGGLSPRRTRNGSKPLPRRRRAATSSSRSTPTAAGRSRRRSSFARLIEQYDIAWFEEHATGTTMPRHGQVRARTTIPINAGQSEIRAWRRAVSSPRGAVDIVNFDASEGGGITEWRRARRHLCATARHEWRTTRNRRSPCIDRGGAARHLCPVFPDPEPTATRSGPACREPAADQERCHGGPARPGLRSRTRLEGAGEIPPRPVI